MARAFQDFLHNTRYDDLPDEVSHFARRWVLDLIGIGAGGSTTDLSKIIRSHAARHFQSHEGSVPMLFDGRRVSPLGAALAGGMTIDALDGHDGFNPAKGHAGCGVFPAAFALANAEGKDDGGEFLTNIVLGYEIGCRGALALHSTVPDYHTSGAWVAVACAALGARIMGLNAAQTRHAIGIAEYHGPRSQMMRCIDHPTMVKDGSGWGAMAGVSAAYMAADGFTGAPAITVESDEVKELWGDLGERWMILEQYYKPYPVCRWAQPPLQAVLNLRAEHDLTSEDVDHIEVVTFHESLRLAVCEPKTTEEAQYSTAYPTAVALVRGTVGLEEVATDAFDDPEVKRIAKGMIVRESDVYNETFPHLRRAHVVIHCKDGRMFESPPTESHGDPVPGVSDEEVTAKFHALAAPVFGEKQAALIERAVATMGKGASVSELTSMICMSTEERTQRHVGAA